MVEPGEIPPIDCACGKAFIWASEEGIELQCRACHRKVLVPFKSLVGRGHLGRFVEQWRDKERKKR